MKPAFVVVDIKMRSAIKSVSKSPIFEAHAMMSSLHAYIVSNQPHSQDKGSFGLDEIKSNFSYIRPSSSLISRFINLLRPKTALKTVIFAVS